VTRAHEKTLWTILIVLLLTSTTITGIGRRTAASGGLPVVSLEPPTVTGLVGETFAVDINVTGITSEESLYSWEFEMSFNTTALDAVNVTEGPFLKDTGYSTNFLSKINNTTGTVKVYGLISELPFPPTGASGSGTLATIIFKAVGQGQTDLEFGEEKNTELWTVITGTGGKQTTTWFAHTAENALFNNGGPPIPLQYIAGIVVVVAVFTAAVFYFRRKRA
jgi:hypothetical protein